jgi:glycosyltransferase involved in cell wall biosynthesis
MSNEIATENAAEAPAVSVLVPWRDRPAELATLIELLGRQTLRPPRFELVICDDGSSSEALASVPVRSWVHVASGPHRNAYAALNRGARVARGSIFATTGSDCQPAPDWLERGISSLESADLVAGEIRALVPDPPTVWSLLDVDKFLNQAEAVAAGSAATGNLFFRRSLFERVGGFEEDFFSGGDYDFARRCVASGARLAYQADVVVSHPAYVTGLSFLKKVWRVNRRAAPTRPRIRNAVPVLAPALGRVRRGLPVGLDGRRLRAHGVRAPLSQRIAALPLLYLVIPPVELAAQAAGWMGRERAAREHPAWRRQRRGR